MSIEAIEVPFRTQNVLDIDLNKVIDPFERKAVLAMQATGHFVDGDSKFEEVNEALQEAAELVSKPATMTYEDVIFRNRFPFGVEGRLFRGVRVISADTDTAQSEAEFYKAHRKIEGYLYKVIGQLTFLHAYPGLFGLGEVPKTPLARYPHFPDETTPGKTMDSALRDIKELHQGMSPEAFSAFRPYFTGLNGYPGASGLYSESIPIIDLLVHGGKNMSDEERETMSSNIKQGLYPNHEGKSVLFQALLDTEEPPLQLPEQMRQDLERKLNQFRGQHMRAVRKFVPEAMQGTADGSGGVENVDDYLKSKLVRGRQGGGDD